MKRLLAKSKAEEDIENLRVQLTQRVPFDSGNWWNDTDCQRCHGKGWIQTFNGLKARNTRLNCDITLREFARRLGYTASFVSDVELGRRKPNKRVIAAYRNLEAGNA